MTKICMLWKDESQLDPALCLDTAFIPLPLPSDTWRDSTVIKQFQPPFCPWKDLWEEQSFDLCFIFL